MLATVVVLFLLLLLLVVVGIIQLVDYCSYLRCCTVANKTSFSCSVYKYTVQ